MDHKEAIKVLLNLLEKNLLNQKEKQAILTAVGVFSWTSLAQNRLKSRKNKIK
jgi:hypothetical protein